MCRLNRESGRDRLYSRNDHVMTEMNFNVNWQQKQINKPYATCKEWKVHECINSL
jgi:hypothetical protein